VTGLWQWMTEALEGGTRWREAVRLIAWCLAMLLMVYGLLAVWVGVALWVRR
jgi:hypothetical protein